MTEAEDLCLRPWDAPSERGFIARSWVMSASDDIANLRPPGADPGHWRSGYGRAVDACLDRAIVLVAAREALCVGFAVVEPGTLHYVYVRHALRRFGVGKRLFEAARSAAGVVLRVSTWTRQGRRCFGGPLTRVAYDPFALYCPARR